MEERVARLEVKVDHLQSDVTEIKARVTRLEDKLDAFRGYVDGKFDEMRERFDKKIDGLRESFDRKIDGVTESFEKKLDKLTEAVHSLRVSRWVDRVWWLVISAGMLAVMARGFKWI